VRVRARTGSRSSRSRAASVVLALAASTIAVSLGAPPAAAAPSGISFDDSPGTNEPPSTLGSHQMTPFSPDARPTRTFVNDVEGPTGRSGSLHRCAISASARDGRRGATDTQVTSTQPTGVRPRRALSFLPARRRSTSMLSRTPSRLSRSRPQRRMGPPPAQSRSMVSAVLATSGSTPAVLHRWRRSRSHPPRTSPSASSASAATARPALRHRSCSCMASHSPLLTMLRSLTSATRCEARLVPTTSTPSRTTRTPRPTRGAPATPATRASKTLLVRTLRSGSRSMTRRTGPSVTAKATSVRTRRAWTRRFSGCTTCTTRQ
jgi:hypothetical protein